MLRSQELRKIAPELDPLRLGTGWKPEDLSKTQILIESTFGDSHPGSVHLLELAEEARKGVKEAGGIGARYFTTDICDGEAQGHDGINYSLASRDMIANMIEIHANATPFDGGIFIASCDKGMPAHLMGLARVNIPSVIVTGGVMDAGPNLLTLEQIGAYSAMYERGEITKEEMDYYKQNACPSCGACSFMGTASTMQIMAEALGLALPGSALLPATGPDLREYAKQAGKQAVWLAEHDIKPVSYTHLYGAIGAGIPPYEIKEVITVVKAYSSAVGAGPFVSEIFGDEAEQLRQKGGDGGEYGATTGRPRRVGWFDAVATRYGCRMQGTTKVALTVLDPLGYLEEIPICVGYEIDGKETDSFPNTVDCYRAKPILRKMPGWRCDIRGIKNFDELPKQAKDYVKEIERLVGYPIAYISNGPGRDDLIRLI